MLMMVMTSKRPNDYLVMIDISVACVHACHTVVMTRLSSAVTLTMIAHRCRSNHALSSAIRFEANENFSCTCLRVTVDHKHRGSA